MDPLRVDVTYINDVSGLSILGESLNAAERVAIDTEVPISGPAQGQLRVMSVATRQPNGDEASFVVDARDIDATMLAPLLAGIQADAWNANFDARVLDAAIWKTTNTTHDLTWWDAQLADALLYQGLNGFNWFHGLAWASKHYLGVDIEGKGTVQLSYTHDDDLTPEQIRYAANDAIVTMWVGDELRRRLAAAELEEVCRIELAARPFLDQMERVGLPFDWPGWKAELVKFESDRNEILSRLAMQTGGGQGSLFDTEVTPSWNPSSDHQVRDALNRYASAEVAAYTASRFGRSRALATSDSVTASVLREIGGPLAETLLEYRAVSKTLSTYGDGIGEHLGNDGRLHSQYLQVVGTNTGRLASRNPNAQNFTPMMKPFIRPSDPDRVFVHADLSQAELRFLAQVSNDEALITAFAAGVDVHVSTAASMFGFDPEHLKVDDPQRFKELRQIAKALNFGIAYGSGAASLGRTLTAGGSPTTTDEARTLLATYRATYPGTAQWAQDRVAEISAIRATTSTIDWRATLRLVNGYWTARELQRDLRRQNHRWPTTAEVAAVHPDRVRTDHQELIKDIEWLLSYFAPVALTADGEPFTFASRTLSGRRQQFNLPTDRVLLGAAVAAAQSEDEALIAARQRFEREHHVRLTGCTSDELERVFDHRPLRRDFMTLVAETIGIDQASVYLSRSARQRVDAMVNAWRNAPIQGGVADIMLVAYAELHRELQQWPDAFGVQTVHDSVAIECHHADAPAIVDMVRSALDAASRRYCPDVKPKADIDVRHSMSDEAS